MASVDKTKSVVNKTRNEQSTESLTKTIWAVAGGKGGTGKTVISANMGIGMAILGYNVVLIDADLGVPNLHTYFGIKRPDATIDDFLTKKVDNLSDIITETPFDNLGFISGGTSLVGIANLLYAKKQRLLKHINKLDADIVIVDLGAGISFNTIDFFNLSSRGVIVTNPEPNSSQDAYFFLKNAAYRRLKLYAKSNEGFKDSFNEYIERNGNGSFDFQNFYTFLPDYSPEVNAEFTDYMDEFRPRLIMNKLHRFGQRSKGNWFINLVEKFLNLEMDYLGGLQFDKKIRESSEGSFPFICKYPKAKITRNMYSILESLNSVEMGKHSITSFREFSGELKNASKSRF